MEFDILATSKWSHQQHSMKSACRNPPKCSKMTNQGPNFDIKSHFWGHLSTLRAENTPKNRHFKSKNNVHKFPKLYQNNFEKVKKTIFLTPKLVENDYIIVQILTKTSLFTVIYQPFELKMHQKIGLLGPKIIPKHFLKNSEKNFGKVPNRLFWTQNCQNTRANFGKKSRFSDQFRI